MQQSVHDHFSSCSDLREINEAKVANILSYLDGAAAVGVYSASTLSGLPLTGSTQYQNTNIESPSLHGEQEKAASVYISPTELLMQAQEGAENAQATYLGIKNKIERLKFEKNELHRENVELRQRLEGWHAQEVTRREELKATFQNDLSDLKRALSAQKKATSLQLTTLTKEKEDLTKNVEALSIQLRHELAHREEDRRAMESAKAATITTLKGKWQVREQAARERWKLAEAKRIKETTLRSLEPDIVLLLNRHKAELSRLREGFENELRQRDEVIAAREAAVDELKSSLQRDAEAALRREHQAFEARLDEEVGRMRRQLSEDQRSEKAKCQQMESFFEDQKNTLQREIERLGREVLELQTSLTKERAGLHEAVAEGVARVTGKSNNMLEHLKEKLMLEFSCREKAAAEQNARHLHTKENELRKKFEIERDAAILEVTQQLKAEQVRLLNSSRGTDDLLRERYGQLQNENERLHVELELIREQIKAVLLAKKEKEKEMESMRDVCNLSELNIKAIETRIRSQYDSKMSILDNAWRTKLNEVETHHISETSELQTQMDALKRELHAERNRFEIEQSNMEQRHHAELNHINERVLVAVTRKDNTIHTQGEQILALQETIKVRDQELQRHRTLLMS
ncbi:unnamed protein product [Phytomonas sp. Hart1]|nr:unnamed protein product [Phytomonas sp. Hart1]|eukprot:CCW69389.1 unnamed protein product [Phytomonas sp. isolate Hart1]